MKTPTFPFRTWKINARLPLLFLFYLLMGSAMPTAAQINTRTALNNQIQYIQNSARQVEAMVESVGELYPRVLKARDGKGYQRLTYRCPYNEEPFYRTEAQTKSGATGQQLLPVSNAFQRALDALVHQCQSLDTYFKLETYKTDQYAGAIALMQEMPTLAKAFAQSQQAYEDKCRSAAQPASPYATADAQLRSIMTLHRDIMANLQYNFNEQVHTGWPKQAVLAHVIRMEDALEEIARQKPRLSYPASAYYQSCLACANDFLESQRDYADNYTIKAQETDEHANDYYRQCLNTYNNCMVSFYNQFTDAAVSDGWKAIHLARTTPVFAFKTTAVPPDKTIRVFQDAAAPALIIAPQNKPISAPTAAALNLYVQFINECARKNNFLLMALRNNGIHYKPFPEKSSLYFSFETHTLPGSLLAEVERQSRYVPEIYRAHLSQLTRQIMDISVEMDGLRQQLVDLSREKQTQSDTRAQAERARDRYVELFAVFDQKKEQLYSSIAKIYASYPTDPAGGSWQLSYDALHKVVQADKILSTAAQSAQPANLPHEAVENAAVKSIQDEFVNLKGIEKLGRYNGLCPYTPYEDVGLNSRRLAEYARGTERKKPTDYIYLYNVVVEDFNRFVELSGRPLLKNTRLMDQFQPELPPPARSSTAPPASKPVSETKPAVKPALQPVAPQRDTVYIHDTIYLEKPPVVGASFYSLEGFAANNLVFLLDVSGSMKTENRLKLLQSSIGRLVKLLREQDDVSVLSFAGKGKVLLPPTSGTKKERILDAINGLRPEGTTNIEEGLKMAFQTARQNFKVQGNNRIILATDGDFILSGPSLELIRQHAELGISLSVFKFGSKPGQNLKAITENGKGNLISITPENAEIFMIKEAQK